MPPGHNLQPLPLGLWGSILLKNISFIWKSITLSKMAFLKFCLDVFGELVGVEGVLVAFQSLLTLKKGTRTLDFQSNESPMKFLRRPLPYEVPLGKNTIINQRQRCSVAYSKGHTYPMFHVFSQKHFI